MLKKTSFIAVLLSAALVLFAALPATDTFSLANWTDLTSYGTWSYITGNDIAWIHWFNRGKTYTENTAWRATGVVWTGDTFGADQYAQIQVVTISAGHASINFGITLRTTVALTTGYLCYAKRDGTMEIYDFGSSTTLATQSGTWPGDNALMRCEVTGSAITMTYGSRTLTATGSASGLGSPGMYCYSIQTGGAEFDTWEAGNLSAPASPKVRPRPIIMSWRRQ